MFIVSAKNQVTVTASHSLYSFFLGILTFFQNSGEEEEEKKRAHF